ncbi:uncharacterized protein LOC118746806 isoform X1 [Rhagoletis pomonella]|uniref:uncharacterized protein LOC118746806 isoform X1 n=1 Tax=Rhagoletis pomonella TaxID=28610 RepID=UPI001786BDDF|nr:uncharacterized protein LOC118746806 isoform X1 [Rhagoletis pomonella]
MFSKLWFLICATQLVIIKGTYDPANSGIKTRSYHRDLPNAEQQNQQSPPYTNTHPRDSRFSPSYDNTNYGAPSLRLSPPDSHQHIDEPRRQQQQQQQQPSYQHQQQHLNPQQAESYQQREQPIFNRPAHVRHSPPSERQVESAWSGTENSIGDHNSGCPPQHTGPVPYPYDCRRFVNCWHGRGHIQSCGPGTVFNPETLECDRPDKVVCGTPGVNGVSSELNVRQTTLQTASNPNKYRAGRLLDVSTGNVDSLCPAGVNGLAPHPTDCTKFLNCANGNTHVQNCGPGTAYSISMKTCDFKEKVDCSGRENGGNGALNSRDGRQYENNNYDNTRDEENGSTANQESDIFCPPGVIGLFPHPFDYTRFLNCKLGNTAIQNCMPGSVYSISRNYCDLKEKTPNTDHVDYVISEVQQLPSTMVSCPPSTDGNHLYPYDSTKFITCRQGRMSIDKCGSHKVFSISAQTCRPESEVTIGDRVRNAVAANSNAEIRDSRNYVDQPLDCPQGQSGLYPHPFDCRKFMLCRNGKLSVESCKTGNVFSLSAKHCDPKELVNVNEQVQFQLDVGQDRVSESDYNYINSNREAVKLICPQNMDGLFLHPFDCTKYLSCHNGQSQVGSCPPGKVFSISRRQCINRNQVDAYDRVEYLSEVKHEFSTELSQGNNNQLLETTCPPDANSVYPYPYDNTKYIKCSRGHGTIENCVKGMIFSTTRRYCDYETKVNEYDRNWRSDNGYDNHKAGADVQEAGVMSEREPKDVSADADVECPPKAIGTYPHPYDCRKFLACSHGVTQVNECAPGTAWSAEMEVCDFEKNVNCMQGTKLPNTAANTIIENRVACPPNMQGLFLHPFNAQHFVNCNNGETIIQTCQTGSVFSISQRMCLAAREVTPVDRVQCSQDYATDIPSYQHYIVCPAQAVGYFVYPFDGLLYIECLDGRTLIQNCAQNTVFSISNQICIPTDEAESTDYVWLRSDWQHINPGYATFDHKVVEWSALDTNSVGAHTQSSVDSTQSTICAESESGLYPHPTDCKKYLRCANGISYEMDCGPGTAFNAALEVCDFEDKVDCSGRLGIGDLQVRNSPAVACPVGASGVYPHPLDCKKFLHCDNDIATIKDCGPGTAWNVKMETCDFMANVGCADGGVRQEDTPEDNGGHGYDANTHFQAPTPQSNNRNPTRNEWIPQPNSAPSHHRGTYDSHSYGGIPTMPSSRTNTRGDRWFNMDRQRPVPHDDTRFIPEGTYNPDYDRQQRLPVYGKDLRHNNGPASWAGTSAALDRQTPTQSVIYEEGSLEPNRNYNTIQTYTTPLAPFNSADSLPAASVNRNVYANATTNIYYAQPVGSEENSDEVFDSNADSQPSARTPLDRNDNKWIPIPNQVLLPPKRTTEQQSVLQVSAPANSYAPATHVTPPSRRAYNPPTTVSQNAIEASNLYGGLQPPPPPPTTAQTPYSIVSIRNQNSPPAPVNPTQSSPPPRPTGRSLVDSFEPIRGFSTNVDGKPHLLSSPSNTNLYQTEILTSTPANYLQPPTAPTAVTKTHSAGTTRLKQVHPFLENTTVAMFSKDPHYSGSYSNVAHASPPQSIDPQAYQSAENLPMADALRLLLRPYFNRSGTISEDSAEKAESHIMKLTAEQPSVHSVMNTLPHTTTNKSKVGAENEKEVELILAGEQHSLSTNPTENSVHGSRTDIYSKNTKQESKNNPNWHNRGHNREYHRTHPNLLNPFDEVDQSSPHRHHHNHNRAFHERHPEMPNPFATPVTLRTVPTTTNNFDLTNANPPNPYAESTTPFSVRPEIDLRAGQDVDCQFDCGNGKCVKSFEVCNGINNCGNRKDEDNCKHLGYEVRLAGGESANMGRVEVKILGKWGYVCDDKFGLRDAEVVCRELGFKLGASEVRGYSYYPPTETEVSFVMDEVDCRGDESSLRECNFKGWGVSNCGPDEVVGVVCKVPQLKCPNNYWLCSTSQECIPPAFVCDHTPDCADKSDESDNVCNSPVEYRLQGGRSPSEGRLEVRYRGEWGTVCDDDFGLKEAQVICNSMGFYGLPTIAKNVYGPGSGPIWLDQVSCFGNETSLEQCNHWTWGEHNCNHTEDVGLKCTVGVQSQKVSTPQTDRNHVDGNGRKELDDPQQELEDIGLFSEWERKSKAIGTQRRRCGQFKDNLLDEYAHPEERVVNGSLAKRGHHPWQATIRTRGRGGISSHWCGAVLISSRHLLTAAHCLAGYPKGAYLVRLGDHYANIAEASEIDSFIENWYVHEKFRDATHMNNDIAMIVLKTPVKFNDYIQPVCLPSKDATVTENRKCTISGWGSIKSGVSTPSNILRAAELPILSDDVCKQPHVYGASLTEGMFCAGYMDESVDACDGDSGGPLICHDEDGETLYGIISWGQHCGYANKPGVYVRVEKYVDWIMDKINFSIQNAT